MWEILMYGLDTTPEFRLTSTSRLDLVPRLSLFTL